MGIKRYFLGILLVQGWIAAAVVNGQAVDSRDYVAGKLVELNDCGAWSWFMDERAIVHEGRLIVGSVRAVGRFDTHQSDPDWGNVEVAVYDIQSGTSRRVVLHRHFEQ